MLIRVAPWLLVAIVACSGVQAQQLPSVEKLIADHDANGDGKLDANEVKGSTFARQFSRWDVDADGFVNAADIIKFRARFGIAPDGSRIGATPVPKMLPVPAVDDLKRADSGTQLTRSERRNSAYVLKTARHLANGDRYVVLTDHNERAFLDPLHPAFFAHCYRLRDRQALDRPVRHVGLSRPRVVPQNRRVPFAGVLWR